MDIIRSGARRIGTIAILAKRAKKIPRRSILRSMGAVEESRRSRDLAREAPRDTKIKGIATAPAVSIAPRRELWRKPVLLKNSSCWRGEIRATMTDARTAHNGGFMTSITLCSADETKWVRRCDGTSDERMLSAGKEVNDSLDAE
jgi:hypothetical protein